MKTLFTFLIMISHNQFLSAQNGKCFAKSKDGKSKIFTNNCLNRTFVWDGLYNNSFPIGKGKLLMYQKDTLFYEFEGTIEEGKYEEMEQYILRTLINMKGNLKMVTMKDTEHFITIRVINMKGYGRIT